MSEAGVETEKETTGNDLPVFVDGTDVAALTAEAQPHGATPRTALQRWLTYLVLAPLLLVWTMVCAVVSLVVSTWDKDGHRQHRIAQVWARVMLRISFSPMRVLHPERLHQPTACVFACNHLSYMDTPALFGTLPFQFRILANHYLFRYPFIGWQGADRSVEPALADCRPEQGCGDAEGRHADRFVSRRQPLVGWPRAAVSVGCGVHGHQGAGAAGADGAGRHL